MTIKERILLFLREEKIKKNDFFNSIGIAASNFKGAAMGSELGGDKIIKILTLYSQLSPDWLLLDDGPMLRKGSSEQVTQEVLPSANESILYKMYKDEREEAGKLKEEIGILKERIRQMEDGVYKEKFTERPTSIYSEKLEHTATTAKDLPNYSKKQ